LEGDVHGPVSSGHRHAPTIYPRSGIPFWATGDCGDFCGDPTIISVHLAASQSSSPQQAKLLTQKALQGFLSSFQRVSKFVEKGFLNRKSEVRIPADPLVSATYGQELDERATVFRTAALVQSRPVIRSSTTLSEPSEEDSWLKVHIWCTIDRLPAAASWGTELRGAFSLG